MGYADYQHGESFLIVSEGPQVYNLRGIAMTTDDLLKQGIAALNAGRKEEAHRLLTRVVQQDKRSEMGWLWLSGAVETDQDRRTCLENVLAINPNNSIAQRGIKKFQGGSSWVGSTSGVAFRKVATIPSMGETITDSNPWPAEEETTTDEIRKTLRQAVAAIKSGDKGKGRQLLARVIDQDDDNELAWYWMAYCVADRDIKRECFEHVLAINPDNTHAIERLKRLDVLSKAESPFKRKSTKQQQTGLIIGLAAVVIVCVGVTGIWWAFNSGLLQLGLAPPTIVDTTQVPNVYVTSTSMPLITGLAADYVLKIGDVPSDYELQPGGSGILLPGDYLDSYVTSFMNESNIPLPPDDPISISSFVYIYRDVDDAVGLTSKLGREMAGHFSHQVREVPVGDFADEVSAFESSKKIEENIVFDTAIVYIYAFRRANVITLIMITGITGADMNLGDTITIDDCKFFADQVFLKIERDLRQ